MAPVKEGTTVLNPSRISTVNAGVIGVPACVFVGCCVTTSIRTGLAAVAVAVTLARPVLLIVSVCAADAAPSVHVVEMRPAASVVPVAAATEPPPVATARVTAAPGTGLPKASLTCATTGAASATPTVPLWPLPETIARDAAAAAATLNALVVADVVDGDDRINV